jgi:hypothetical protein
MIEGLPQGLLRVRDQVQAAEPEQGSKAQVARSAFLAEGAEADENVAHAKLKLAEVQQSRQPAVRSRGQNRGSYQDRQKKLNEVEVSDMEKNRVFLAKCPRSWTARLLRSRLIPNQIPSVERQGQEGMILTRDRRSRSHWKKKICAPRVDSSGKTLSTKLPIQAIEPELKVDRQYLEGKDL